MFRPRRTGPENRSVPLPRNPRSHVQALQHEVRGDGDFVSKRTRAIRAIYGITQSPFEWLSGHCRLSGVNPVGRDQECIEGMIFLAIRQPTSVFAVSACLGQRELQRKGMGSQQRIAAPQSFDARDAPIEGSTDQSADPIDGGSMSVTDASVLTRICGITSRGRFSNSAPIRKRSRSAASGRTLVDQT